MTQITPMPVTRVSDLISNLPSKENDPCKLIFRGQADLSHKLVPSLFRGKLGNNQTWQGKGDGLLEEFARSAEQYIGKLPIASTELIALAQHHGVPTRYLDWSFNPLVALFFAVESEPEKNAIVWASSGSPIQTQQYEDIDSGYVLSGETVFQPTVSTPRIQAQQACFTLHKYPKGNSPFIPMGKSMHVEPKVYQIDAADKDTIKSELNTLGVNNSTIYPDLEGLGKHLNWLSKNGAT